MQLDHNLESKAVTLNLDVTTKPRIRVISDILQVALYNE